MHVNLNKRFKKPFSSEDARCLLEIQPKDAEIYFDGKFFKHNTKKTSYLTWSATLQKWIMWLHEKPDFEQSISIPELAEIANKA